MNEQITENEEMETAAEKPFEEVSCEEKPFGEEIPAEDIASLKSRLEQSESENAELRQRLFCMGKGIPESIAEDMICLAKRRCEKDGCDFETAVQEAYDRISGFAEGHGNAAHSAAVTTGVRCQSGTDFADDPLRRAFGLR